MMPTPTNKSSYLSYLNTTTTLNSSTSLSSPSVRASCLPSTPRG